MVYCKFCKHKITVGITRLKHHLVDTKKDVKICAQALANVKQACKDMLLATELEKESLVREIGMMGETIGRYGMPRIEKRHRKQLPTPNSWPYE